jgi:monothiol glutaredoxin
MSLDPSLRDRLNSLVQVDDVVLFMKGHRNAPQCGFSAQSVEILDAYLPHFCCFDVLADTPMREGIKQLSDWPTIPQLYVKGEFVGGADILAQMDQSGELVGLLGEKRSFPDIPQVEITAAAAEQISAALADAGGDVLRLGVDYRYHNDLLVGVEEEDDIVVESRGISLHFDKESARRANGVVLDFVTDGRGTGFSIDNPNCPPQVKELSVVELKERLGGDEELRIYDVRSPREREIAALEATVLFDEDSRLALETLHRKTPIYFMCHHGGRSRAAAEQYVGMGFHEVYNVAGGIDAWSAEIDPEIPRY